MKSRRKVGPRTGTETTNHNWKHDRTPICPIELDEQGNLPEGHRWADLRHPTNCSGCLGGYVSERLVAPSYASVHEKLNSRKPMPTANHPWRRSFPRMDARFPAAVEYVPHKPVDGHFTVDR